MSALIQISLYRFLLGLVSVALLSLPFAHRTGAQPLTPEMAEYLAMGGTVAELCGETGTAPAGGCESCRIGDTMLLVPPVVEWRAAQVSAVLRVAQDRPSAPKRRRSQSPPARAPPMM
ncbi:hypothetical protein [Sulfitobacter sp.]|uniref:hypothetical protein n=1 Tax=Sulfitobacter sp. TaxID=1903071 RepID=UPI0032986B3F